MTDNDISQALAAGADVASLLNEYVFGRGMWDPAFPHHRAPRRCPFCDQPYFIHAGFADHRDRCEQGPSPGSNPVTPAGGEP